MNEPPTKEDAAVAAVISMARSLEAINATLLTILDLMLKQHPQKLDQKDIHGLFALHK